MKTVLYKVLFIFILPIVFTRCEKEPDPKITVPDANFLNALFSQGVDKNYDNIISPAEAEKITFLDVSENNIADLTGIEAFVNLETLRCSDNQLTSLDVSNNTVLRDLSCRSNQLTSLDISKNTALESLSCSSNQLTSLDVSKNTTLGRLSCGSNQLSILDVSKNTLLTSLSCDSNQLTSLDVSNNSSISILDIKKMPSLYEVCVWEMPFPPAGIEVDITNSPNVYFTTECSGGK